MYLTEVKMNWPFNKEYKKIFDEAEIGDSGFYPFGAGNLWHSGIHINAKEGSIAPIIPGELISYRLRYKNLTGNLPSKCTKTYYETFLQEYSSLYNNNDDKNVYILEQNQKRVSIDSYMLFKHNFSQMDYTFYSLYTNLGFITDKNEKDFKDVLQIDGEIHNCKDKPISISRIPVGNKYLNKSYFDFVIFSEENIFNKKIKDDKNKISLFKEFPKGIKFYSIKITEKNSSDIYMIPNLSEYIKIADKTNSLHKFIQIKLTSFYTMYKVVDKTVYWVSPSDWSTGRIDFPLNKEPNVVNNSLKYLKEKLVQGDFVNKYKTEKNCNTVDKKTAIRFDKLGVDSPVFWLKGFDVNDFKEEINKEAKCENGSSTKEYKIFLECPYEYSFTEINVSEYEDFDIDLTCKYEGIVDGISVEFYKIKDKDYYVKVSDLGGCFADAYDWKEWFKDFSEKIGSSDGIICDKNALIKKLDCQNELNEIFPKAKKYYPSDFYRIYGGYGNDDSQKEIIKKVRKETRKIICKHPLEFDESLFPANDEDAKNFSKRYKEISQSTTVISPTTSRCLQIEASNFDIWKNGLSKIFTKGNSFYFLHPVYSIRHFERAGLFEFNPYEESVNKNKLVVLPSYKTSPKGVKYGSDGGTEVLNIDSSLNNPGCAPFIMTNGKEDYASLTGVFNEDYLKVARYMNGDEPDLYSNYRTKYHHFGVDFSAKEGTSVKSFIYGTVIAKGWISSDGRCLLIQRKSNNYLYLLCHLKGYPDNIKVGGNVCPGDIIAFTGCSGVSKDVCSETTFSAAPHLHVSVLKYEKEAKIVNLLKKDRKSGTTEDKYSWADKYIPTYVDPFSYDKLWKGKDDIKK